VRPRRLQFFRRGPNSIFPARPKIALVQTGKMDRRTHPMGDDALILRDMTTHVNRFVREDLFQCCKWIYDEKDLEEAAGPFKLFLKLCGHRVGEGRLGNVEEQKRYVRMLWTRLRARRYKDGKRNQDMATVATMLSQRRTSVYTVMQGRFNGKVFFQ
jgi:hypothetical protein